MVNVLYYDTGPIFVLVFASANYKVNNKYLVKYVNRIFQIPEYNITQSKLQHNSCFIN